MKLKCLSWLRGGGGGGGGCLVWPVDVAPEPLVTALDLLGVGGGLEADLGGGRGLGAHVQAESKQAGLGWPVQPSRGRV